MLWRKHIHKWKVVTIFNAIYSHGLKTICLVQRCPTHSPLTTCDEWMFKYGKWAWFIILQKSLVLNITVFMTGKFTFNLHFFVSTQGSKMRWPMYKIHLCNNFDLFWGMVKKCGESRDSFVAIVANVKFSFGHPWISVFYCLLTFM